MLKKALILVLAGIMFFSSFAVLATDLPTSTYSQNLHPANLIGGYYVGNVTLHPDGTVTGTGHGQVPLTQVSTNTYSLDENINGTISILRNSSTLNGGGLTVNGGSNTAVKASNVTGITIRDLTIVNITSSKDGINFYGVYNSVLDNVTINNTRSADITMVSVYYSGNVTIENSNFLLGSFNTQSYGIDAEYDSAINVSTNNFSGLGNIQYVFYFVYCYAVGQLNAWGNYINHTSGYPLAFEFFDGGNAVFANNYINNTYEAICAEYEQSVTSMNNYISNSPSGIEVEDASTYTSYNDTVVSCGESLYLDDLGNAIVQFGNFSNSTSYSYFDYCNYVTVTHSLFSSTSTFYAVESEYGSTLNLYNDQIIVGNSSSVNAVYADYMAGWVNLANDYIYAPNGYGLYLDSDECPQFNVTNSYLNASYGIFAGNDYAVVGATISGNTFVGQDMQAAAYLDYAGDIYNVNFSNNTVQSPNSSSGVYALYLCADEMSSNITVSSNTITNNRDPIYLYAYSTGSNAIVQNNTVVNSITAIDVEYYSNTVITGNKIINVSDIGIYAYADDYTNVIVSYNQIENPVDLGMNYGICLEGFYGGYNVVSHNTVFNPGTLADEIYVYECTPVLVFSNIVNGGKYGFDMENSGPISFFGNTASNANTGINSYEDYNFSYYGNTVINTNTSFYSQNDEGGYLYANTFSDSQINNPSLNFLYILGSKGITFYHNNFLNVTSNSTVHNLNSNATGPLFMNALLPTGGNYWSSYTGTGINGIGDSPMNVTGAIQDLYPLMYKWNSPIVTFIETGLALGTSWSASLGESQATSTGNTIVFNQNNGQYLSVGYEIGSVAGYTASLSFGSVYLNGATSTVTVTFTPLPYKVTFTESGLSGNTSWAVTLNGNTKTTNTSSLNFNIANGTYNYSIGSVPGFTASKTTGTVTVNGETNPISVQFQSTKYTLTVNETGLPAGNSWTITVGNQSFNSTSSTMEIELISGNYNVTVSGPSGYTVSLSASNVTINNANCSFNVSFSNSKGGSNLVLYGGIGAAAVVGGAVGTLSTMFYTGTGIFRKPGDK